MAQPTIFCDTRVLKFIIRKELVVSGVCVCCLALFYVCLYPIFPYIEWVASLPNIKLLRHGNYKLYRRQETE